MTVCASWGWLGVQRNEGGVEARLSAEKTDVVRSFFASA